MWRASRFLADHTAAALSVVVLAYATVQAAVQSHEDARVRRLASDLVVRSGATTDRQKVLALRDYLRSRCTFRGAEHAGRPFFRASAWETLETGLGYCGEVTRTFICLARQLGIPAQRINLYGAQPHVVADVPLDGVSTLVDCQQPPHIPDLEALDAVLARGMYTDYSTINLRRTGLGWTVERFKIRLGRFTYLTENPHALKAVMAVSALAGFWACKLARRAARVVLRRRGWIHRSDAQAVRRVAAAH